MRKFNSLLLIASLATLAACQNELTPDNNGNEEQTKRVIRLHATADAPTKATLTDDYDLNKVFNAGWEDGKDYITVDYTAGLYTDAVWNQSEGAFVSDDLADGENLYAYFPKGADNGCIYDFDGENGREQNGNAYNSNYDLMYSEAFTIAKDATDVTVKMNRATAIQYFHLIADGEAEWANKKIVSATLSVTGENAVIAAESVLMDGTGALNLDGEQTSIKLSFPPATAPTANDLQLWFNVLPGKVESMTISVELEDGYSWEMTNNFKGNGYTFVAGKLGYVKGAPTYEKTESLKKYAILAKRASGNYFFLTSNDASNETRFDAIDSESESLPLKYTGGDGAYIWQLVPVTGGYKLQSYDKQKFVDWSSGNTASLSNYGKVFTMSAPDANGAITLSFASSARETRYLAMNSTSGNNYFACYTAQAKNLYLVPAGDPKTKQTLTFEGVVDDKVTAYLGESFDTPELTGAHTAVTYTSSSSAIAEIDAETGAITPKGIGTTVITATAEEDETYDTASASYTLTVMDRADYSGKKFLVGQKAEKYYAASAYVSGDNLKTSEVTIADGNVIYLTTITGCVMTFMKKDNGRYTIQDANDKYLTPASANSSRLTGEDEEHEWIVRKVEGVWSIISATATYGTMRYNATSNLFNCYQSSESGAAVVVYDVVGDPVAPHNLSVSPASVTLEGDAQATASVAITSNYAWTVVEDSFSGFSLSKTSGTGDDTITITALNDGGASETQLGTFTIKETTEVGTPSKTVTVNQLSHSVKTYYRKVTEAPANWAGTYLIVFSDNKPHSAIKVNSRSKDDFIADENAPIVTPDSEGKIVATATLASYVVVVNNGSTEGAYTMQLPDGKYLYIPAANGMCSKETPTDLFLGYYSGTNQTGVQVCNGSDLSNTSNRILYYNYNNGSPAYRTYTEKIDDDSYVLPDFYLLDGSAPEIVDVQSVSLNKTAMTLLEGGNETLTATVNPSDATYKKVTWSSSKESVATVDQTGKVTAVSAGEAVITAAAGGKSATCTVTVNEVTKYDISVSGFTSEEGTVTISGNLTQAPAGTNITVTVTAKPGYDFKSVTLDGVTKTLDSNKQFTFVMPAASVSIVATFDAASTKKYTLVLTSSDIAAVGSGKSGYGKYNGDQTWTAKAADGSTMEVKAVTNQVMPQSNKIQLQKSNGYIYNTTNLGSIESVTLETATNTTTTIGSSQNPTTAVTGGGYFKIKATSGGTPATAKITIVFTK